MKKNKERADKILAIFKAKFPLLTVTHIFDSNDGTIVRALKNPEKIKMGVPFYQLLSNGAVVNANPYGNYDWFIKIVQDDNMIYHNTDIEEPEIKKIIRENDIVE